MAEDKNHTIRKDNFVEKPKKGFISAIYAFLAFSFINQLLTILSFSILSSIFISLMPDLNSGYINQQILNVFQKEFMELVFIISSFTLTILGLMYILSSQVVIKLFKSIFSVDSLLYGFLGFLLIIIFSIVYNTLIFEKFNLPISDNQESVVNVVFKTPFSAFALTVLIAPFLEEITFRYGLFGSLVKRNKIFAYIITGLIFMGSHLIQSFFVEMDLHGRITSGIFIQLLTMPPYLMAGLILAYIYDISNRFGAPFIAHFLNNLLAFLLIALSK